MKLHYAFLALMFVTTPALAKHFGAGSAPKKGQNICVPSSDPSVPPCGVKDESPTYFPDKLAQPAAAKPATATTPPPLPIPGESKKTKHTKVKTPAPKADAAAPASADQGTWEKGQ